MHIHVLAVKHIISYLYFLTLQFKKFSNFILRLYAMRHLDPCSKPKEISIKLVAQYKSVPITLTVSDQAFDKIISCQVILLLITATFSQYLGVTSS